MRGERKMDDMIEKLKTAESLEQMINMEDEIAKSLGHGFLNGEFKYEDLMQIKERVEQIETERRDVLETEISGKEKRPSKYR